MAANTSLVGTHICFFHVHRNTHDEVYMVGHHHVRHNGHIRMMLNSLLFQFTLKPFTYGRETHHTVHNFAKVMTAFLCTDGHKEIASIVGRPWCPWCLTRKTVHSIVMLIEPAILRTIREASQLVSDASLLVGTTRGASRLDFFFLFQHGRPTGRPYKMRYSSILHCHKGRYKF